MKNEIIDPITGAVPHRSYPCRNARADECRALASSLKVWFDENGSGKTATRAKAQSTPSTTKLQIRISKSEIRNKSK